MWCLGADGVGVRERQLIGLHAGVLAGQGGNGAAEHHDEVGAELGEAAPLSGTEAFTEADEQKQGGYAPGNPEHGQEGA